VVVVTSIKSEHNRSFATLLDTRKEKVKMVAALSPAGLAVLNGDDPHVRWMATQTRARVVFFGFGEENDVRAANVRVTEGGGTRFDVSIGADTLECRSALRGEHMVYPMLAAITVARAEGLELGGVMERLAKLEPEKSRMQTMDCPSGIRVVDDSYKGAVESFQAAFDACAAMTAGRKVLVLGNLEEPPGNEREIYRELGRRAAGFADEVICVGKDSWRAFRASAVQAGMKQEAIRLVGSRIEPAQELLKTLLRPGDVVLIKGSSRQKLRRIALAISGVEVGCRMHYCNAKVGSCDECPLLRDSRPWEKNIYVRRMAKM
jgi:UDP-N-acetylmuramoyl-tripeptide--D-alanyl-D-alanine ligase